MEPQRLLGSLRGPRRTAWRPLLAHAGWLPLPCPRGRPAEAARTTLGLTLKGMKESVEKVNTEASAAAEERAQLHKELKAAHDDIATASRSVLPPAACLAKKSSPQPFEGGRLRQG